MKKIAFKNIETREQLIDRLENGILSVGANFKFIRHFLNDVSTDTQNHLITVRYSSRYGHTDKQFYI